MKGFAVTGRTNARILNKIFNVVDSGTTAFTAAKFDPLVPFQGQKPAYADEVEARYGVTELNNGFTVLTEGETFPGVINLGKFQLLQRLGQACRRLTFFLLMKKDYCKHLNAKTVKF